MFQRCFAGSGGHAPPASEARNNAETAYRVEPSRIPERTADQMHDNVQATRMTHSARARVLALATLASVVLLTGCGGSSQSPTATTSGGASNSASVAPVTGSATTGTSRTTAGADASGALAFSECMRASGVSNFPDPQPGGRLLFSLNGINANAPSFRAAQAKCRKVLPGGGPPGPGTQTHPSAQTLAKLVRIAECMRQHGVPDFPDPRTSVPSSTALGQYQEITNFDGVILLFPSTLNLQAPAYKHALAACGAPPLGLPH